MVLGYFSAMHRWEAYNTLHYFWELEDVQLWFPHANCKVGNMFVHIAVWLYVARALVNINLMREILEWFRVLYSLTHKGLVTLIWFSELSHHWFRHGLIFQQQAITWANFDWLSVRPLGGNYSKIWIQTWRFFFKMHLKILFRNVNNFVCSLIC